MTSAILFPSISVSGLQQAEAYSRPRLTAGRGLQQAEAIRYCKTGFICELSFHIRKNCRNILPFLKLVCAQSLIQIFAGLIFSDWPKMTVNTKIRQVRKFPVLQFVFFFCLLIIDLLPTALVTTMMNWRRASALTLMRYWPFIHQSLLYTGPARWTENHHPRRSV